MKLMRSDDTILYLNKRLLEAYEKKFDRLEKSHIHMNAVKRLLQFDVFTIDQMSRLLCLSIVNLRRAFRAPVSPLQDLINTIPHFERIHCEQPLVVWRKFEKYSLAVWLEENNHLEKYVFLWVSQKTNRLRR